MTALCGLLADAVRVRMAGRDDTEVIVSDMSAPPIVQRDGWAAHAVRFVAADAAWPEIVVPAEQALTRAAPRRLAAYLAGRYCAARALDVMGRGDLPVMVGAAGAPTWPTGVVGSISHTDGRALAVVASSACWRSLGVDCERVLDAGAADEVARIALAEVDALDVTGSDALSWAEFVTVGFSAKESLYKCLRPLVGTFFDFADAHLTHLDRDARRVRLRLARDLAPGFACGTTFDMAFALTDGHAHTCLALPVTTGPTALEYVA